MTANSLPPPHAKLDLSRRELVGLTRTASPPPGDCLELNLPWGIPMDRTINAKQLRAHLQDIVAQVKRGDRFTVLYRSRPAFGIVPVGSSSSPSGPPEADPLYGAGPVGSSASGEASLRHDEILYRWRPCSWTPPPG